MHNALIIAGIIFAIIAVVHLMRLYFKSEITIAGKIIPLWVSMIGFVFALLLSVWMFVANSS